MKRIILVIILIAVSGFAIVYSTKEYHLKKDLLNKPITFMEIKNDSGKIRKIVSQKEVSEIIDSLDTSTYKKEKHSKYASGIFVHIYYNGVENPTTISTIEQDGLSIDGITYTAQNEQAIIHFKKVTEKLLNAQ